MKYLGRITNFSLLSHITYVTARKETSFTILFRLWLVTIGYNFLDFFKAIKVMVAVISHAKNKVIKIFNMIFLKQLFCLFLTVSWKWIL